MGNCFTFSIFFCYFDANQCDKYKAIYGFRFPNFMPSKNFSVLDNERNTPEIEEDFFYIFFQLDSSFGIVENSIIITLEYIASRRG